MTNTWIKIAESAEAIPFGTNGIAELEAGGRRFCVAKYKEQLFAFAPQCPHASGRFREGFIDALGNVVCPLHRYKFCLKNGYNVSGEGYYLKHWPVKAENGIFIHFGLV
jgi:3-phenylpropionate/trans-cinnamate dioxygenase ferredoxin subunit